MAVVGEQQLDRPLGDDRDQRALDGSSSTSGSSSAISSAFTTRVSNSRRRASDSRRSSYSIACSLLRSIGALAARSPNEQHIAAISMVMAAPAKTLAVVSRSGNSARERNIPTAERTAIAPMPTPAMIRIRRMASTRPAARSELTTTDRRPNCPA